MKVLGGVNSNSTQVFCFNQARNWSAIGVPWGCQFLENHIHSDFENPKIGFTLLCIAAVQVASFVSVFLERLFYVFLGRIAAPLTICCSSGTVSYSQESHLKNSQWLRFKINKRRTPMFIPDYRVMWGLLLTSG